MNNIVNDVFLKNTQQRLAPFVFNSFVVPPAPDRTHLTGCLCITVVLDATYKEMLMALEGRCEPPSHLKKSLNSLTPRQVSGRNERDHIENIFSTEGMFLLNWKK